MRGPNAAALLLLVTLSGVAHAESKDVTLDGPELLVTNLTGRVHVTKASGDKFVVHVRPGGKDASVIDVRSDAAPHELDVVFPIDATLRWRNPSLKGQTEIPVREWRKDKPGAAKLASKASGTIKLSPSRGDKEAWADVDVEVPKGAKLGVMLGAGDVDAQDIDASLVLMTHAGAATIADAKGGARVETGSGDVSAARVSGDLAVETGSGDVEAQKVDGKVKIETGSGDVKVSATTGALAHVETGSGHVDAREVQTDRLELSAGSGHVDGNGIDAASFKVETGSGRIRLHFRSLNHGDGSVETGSGEVAISLPKSSSARVDAETGSGDLDLDVPGAKIDHQDRGELSVSIGDGKAHLRVETGSGGISIDAHDND